MSAQQQAEQVQDTQGRNEHLHPTLSWLVNAASPSVPPLDSEAAYRALVQRITNQEPRQVWTSAADLPPLRDADVIAVCQARTQAVIDEMAFDPQTVARSLMGQTPMAILGRYLRNMTERACHEVIWLDVFVEREAVREETRTHRRSSLTESQPAESNAGVLRSFR